MKKFLSLFIIIVAFSSCQEDLKTNNPSIQGLKDDVFWIANDARAYVSPTGTLSIKGLTQFEELTLNTSSTAVGTYFLGTTNANNKAIFTSNFNETELLYETNVAAGPAFGVSLISGGSGYVTANSVATTGGTGSGLTVKIEANTSGVVTKVLVASGGNGYISGDLITVTGGNLNCKFRVVNGGEIKIEEYDNVNMTISGTFKFNAANVNNNPAGGPILNYQYGAFYKVQIFPAQ